MMDYSKPKRLTSSGHVVERSCVMSNFSIKPGSDDVIVFFRDGESDGTVVWSAEADNASGSHAESFVPPMRFANKLYVEIQTSGNNANVSVALVEPASTTDI